MNRVTPNYFRLTGKREMPGHVPARRRQKEFQQHARDIPPRLSAQAVV